MDDSGPRSNAAFRRSVVGQKPCNLHDPRGSLRAACRGRPGFSVFFQAIAPGTSDALHPRNMGASDNLLGLFIALGILAYLVYALVRAERF
jgi:hypothetical protein